ncbi:hypothetical protein BH18ACT4_BH18ACT4_11020 [soil metagenome]
MIVREPSVVRAPDGSADRRRRLKCLHRDPPMTPASFLLPRRRLLIALGVVFVALAFAATFDGGRLLLVWDGPIQRTVESSRTPWLDRFFLLASTLGSTKVVLGLGALGAFVTWRRCRAVAIAVALATVSRPLLDFCVKALVGRDRPDLDRLVPGNGPSFPSGHVMASVALWGLLPLVVALWARRRSVWWASVFLSGVLLVTIAASRVYLGVHWFSDVTGGLVAGAFFLVGVEWVLGRAHDRHPCESLRQAEPETDPDTINDTISDTTSDWVPSRVPEPVG